MGRVEQWVSAVKSLANNRQLSNSVQNCSRTSTYAPPNFRFLYLNWHLIENLPITGTFLQRPENAILSEPFGCQRVFVVGTWSGAQTSPLAPMPAQGYPCSGLTKMLIWNLLPIKGYIGNGLSCYFRRWLCLLFLFSVVLITRFHENGSDEISSHSESNFRFAKHPSRERRCSPYISHILYMPPLQGMVF